MSESLREELLLSLLLSVITRKPFAGGRNFANITVEMISNKFYVQSICCKY
jgi:hypothetical protein